MNESRKSLPTNTQTNIQSNTHTITQTNIQTHTHTNTQTNIQSNTQTHIQTNGKLYKYDISLKINNINIFIQNIINKLLLLNYNIKNYNKKPLINRFIGYDFQICCFGHLGDQNLHLNMLFTVNNDYISTQMITFNDLYNISIEINDLVYNEVIAMNGSISAEHGIGQSKLRYLEISKSKEELILMSNLKKLYDFKNILNPSKVILEKYLL